MNFFYDFCFGNWILLNLIYVSINEIKLQNDFSLTITRQYSVFIEL